MRPHSRHDPVETVLIGALIGMTALMIALVIWPMPG